MYLKAYASKNDHEGILRKYEEMKSLGVSPSEAGFTLILRASSSRNNLSYSRSIYSFLRQSCPRNSTHGSLFIRILASHGDFLSCFEEITQLRADGMKLTAGLYNPLLETIAKSEDRGALARALNEMSIDGVSANKHVQDLVDQVMDGKKLEDIRVNGSIQSYNVQLSNLAREDNPSIISKTINDMERDGVEFDIATYNVLLPYAVRKENYDEVRRLHAKLVASGIRPDTALYHALTQGYVGMKDGIPCAQLVDVMLKDNVQLALPQFQALLLVIVENLDLPRCHKMLAHMRAPPQATLDVPVYGVVVDLMLTKGDLSGCNQIMSEMKTKNVKPSLAIYNSLIAFAAQKGDKTWIALLMDETVAQGLQVDLTTYTKLFEGLAINGDAEGCDEWLATMRNKSFSPTRNIYHSIVQAKAIRGDAEGCTRIVREMGVRGMTPDPQAYTVTLHLVVKRGDQINARALYEDMRRRGVNPDRLVFNLIALVSNSEDGVRLLPEMRQSGVIPDLETYRGLLGNMGLRGDVEGCRWALEEMGRDGVIPDMATYNSLVSNLGRHVDMRVLCSKLLEAIPPQGKLSFSLSFSLFILSLLSPFAKING